MILRQQLVWWDEYVTQPRYQRKMAARACKHCGAIEADHEPSGCCGDGGGSTFLAPIEAFGRDGETRLDPEGTKAGSAPNNTTSLDRQGK